MEYKAQVNVLHYNNGEVIDEQTLIRTFKDGTPIDNRKAAFNYIKGLEDVFENELNDRVIKLEELRTAEKERVTGIYYESSLSFYSTRLEEEVNLFHPTSNLLEDEIIEWYQIGLVEELIELSNFMTNNELEDFVTLTDHNHIVLEGHIGDVQEKVLEVENMWRRILGG